MLVSVSWCLLAVGSEKLGVGTFGLSGGALARVTD